MNKLPLWKLRAASWLPILGLALLLSVLAYSSGHAAEGPPRTAADAQSDSIVDAFYLLQFDYAVDKARWEAGAKLDSLRIKDIMAGFEEQRKQQRREVMAAGVGALLAVAIVWIIRGTAE